MRLEGYDALPSVLPAPLAGRGLTERQRLRRAVVRALAAAGYTEALSYPFVAPRRTTTFGLPADDPRRRARCGWPTRCPRTEPELRTSLLPGLLSALVRNRRPGQPDLALFEVGLVFRRRSRARAPRRPRRAHPAERGELAAHRRRAARPAPRRRSRVGR